MTLGSQPGREIDALFARLDSLVEAVVTLQELNLSFNLQYLVLQQKIQTQTREFNRVSDRMRKKHSEAKRAVNTIR